MAATGGGSVSFTFSPPASAPAPATADGFRVGTVPSAVGKGEAANATEPTVPFTFSPTGAQSRAAFSFALPGGSRATAAGTGRVGGGTGSDSDDDDDDL